VQEVNYTSIIIRYSYTTQTVLGTRPYTIDTHTHTGTYTYPRTNTYTIREKYKYTNFSKIQFNPS